MNRSRGLAPCVIASGFLVLGAYAEKPAGSEAIERQFAESVAQARRLSVAVQGKTIRLGDALRITLDRHPSIRLAKEDVEIAHAAVVGAAAPFDLSLVGDLRHGREYRPLSDREIAEQTTARRLASEALDVENQRLAQSLQIQANADQLRSQAIVLGALQGGATLNSVAAANLVTAQQSQLQVTQARLDSLLSRPVATTVRKGVSSYSLGLSKLTRSGVIVNPYLDWSPRGETDNTASINLDLVIPLAQGRGAVAERAFEDATRVDLEASKWQLRHEIARSLLNTAVAYWNLLAAQQVYGLLMDTEEIVGTFTDLAQLRFQMEEMAAGEFAIAQARLYEVVTERIQFEFNIFRARHQLALAMGLEGEELMDPPYAWGVLPEPIPAEELLAMSEPEMIRRALILRDDQRAAIQLTRSGKILARAAKFEQKPVIDLFFEFAYTGVDDGRRFESGFSTFADDLSGLGAFGGVHMNWPLELNAARSNFQRSEAFFQQRAINAMDLERTIASNSVVALLEAKTTYRQIASTQQAADYSLVALVTARAKYNEEATHLINAIQLEEKYSNDLRAVIVAYLNHLVAVSQLRFQTGTFLEASHDDRPEAVALQPANLIAMPDWKAYPDTPIGPVETNLDQPPRPLLKRRGAWEPPATGPEGTAEEAREISGREKAASGSDSPQTKKPRPLLDKVFNRN